MNTKRWTLALALFALFALSALPTLAATTETTTAHFVISSPEAGNAEFDIENPEVGDVETFWTDTGEPVTVTYDDEGFLVDIDGKEIRISAGMTGMPHLPHGASGFVFESDDEHEIVLDGSAGDGQVMIWHSDDEEGEDGEVEKRIHVIKRHHSTVEIDEDGETKVLHIPGGDDIKVLRTKDEEGNVQVKILRNGEELDLEELADGEGNVRIIKMGEGHGPHCAEGANCAHGAHVIMIGEEEGGEPRVIKIHKKMGDSGASGGTQIQVRIRKTIEEEE